MQRIANGCGRGLPTSDGSAHWAAGVTAGGGAEQLLGPARARILNAWQWTYTICRNRVNCCARCNRVNGNNTPGQSYNVTIHPIRFDITLVYGFGNVLTKAVGV